MLEAEIAKEEGKTSVEGKAASPEPGQDSKDNKDAKATKPASPAAAQSQRRVRLHSSYSPSVLRFSPLVLRSIIEWHKLIDVSSPFRLLYSVKMVEKLLTGPSPNPDLPVSHRAICNRPC